MGLEERDFTLRGETCTDDANRLLVTLGPNDEDDAARDRSNRDETILVMGVLFVKNLEAVGARKEQSSCFLKGHSMLLPVRTILRLVPDYPHRDQDGTPLA